MISGIILSILLLLANALAGIPRTPIPPFPTSWLQWDTLYRRNVTNATATMNTTAGLTIVAPAWTPPTPEPDMYWQRLPWNYTQPLRNENSSITLPLLPLYTTTRQNEYPRDAEEGGGHAAHCPMEGCGESPMACVALISWRNSHTRYGWCRNLTLYPNVDPKDIIIPEYSSTALD